MITQATPTPAKTIAPQPYWAIDVNPVAIPLISTDSTPLGPKTAHQYPTRSTEISVFLNPSRQPMAESCHPPRLRGVIHAAEPEPLGMSAPHCVCFCHLVWPPPFLLSLAD